MKYILNNKILIITTCFDEFFPSIPDCRLMFNNCRLYNEEGSDIVKDANTLERRLYQKTKEMGIVTGPAGKARGSKTSAVGSPNVSMTSGAIVAPMLASPSSVNASSKKNLAEKIKKLVDTVKEYKDPKGRQLSIIFMKLPNIKEFSDYYEVIKKPIDLDKIGKF